MGTNLTLVIVVMVGAVVISIAGMIYAYAEEQLKHKTRARSDEAREEASALRTEVTQLRERMENLETLLIENERDRPWRELETESNQRDAERV